MRTQGDLIWLVREGYVTEFIDGGLYAPPAMVEARKKEVESEEVDPENFPEAPRLAETQPAPAPPAVPAVSAPVADVAAPAETSPSAEAPSVAEAAPVAPAAFEGQPPGESAPV